MSLGMEEYPEPAPQTSTDEVVEQAPVVVVQRTRAKNTAKSRRDQRFVTQSDFGAGWPFTVDYGRLSCRGAGEVYFIAPDRTSYPLNGLARAATASAPDVRDIWAGRDSAPEGWNPDLSALIPAGLELCAD